MLAYSHKLQGTRLAAYGTRFCGLRLTPVGLLTMSFPDARHIIKLYCANATLCTRLVWQSSRNNLLR